MREAVFREDNGRFVPTRLAKGGWAPDAMHGGAPSALMTQLMIRQQPDRFLARATIDLVRTVPLATLEAEVVTLATGRRVARTAVVLRAGGVEVARAQGLHMTDRDIAIDVSDTLVRRPDECAPPGPAEAQPPAEVPDNMRHDGFHEAAMEVRFLHATDYDRLGPEVVWARFKVPLIAGQETPPLCRLAAVADLAGGASSVVSWRTHTFINADISFAVAREPDGEWIGIDAVTRPGQLGNGVAASRIYDETGLVGHALSSMVIDRRARPVATD